MYTLYYSTLHISRFRSEKLGRHKLGRKAIRGICAIHPLCCAEGQTLDYSHNGARISLLFDHPLSPRLFSSGGAAVCLLIPKRVLDATQKQKQAFPLCLTTTIASGNLLHVIRPTPQPHSSTADYGFFLYTRHAGDTKVPHKRIDEPWLSWRARLQVS